MDYPLTVPGVGLVGGKFSDEMVNPGQQPSLDPAAWANAVTDELLALQSAGGQVADEGNKTQIRDAVLSLLRDIPVSAGTNDAYTVMLPAYSDLDGRCISFIPHVANIANATLDINAQGAHDIYYLRQQDGVLTQVTAGVMRKDIPAKVVFINGDYILLNPFETIGVIENMLSAHINTSATRTQSGHVALSDSMQNSNTALHDGLAPSLRSIYKLSRSNWATSGAPFMEVNGPTITLPNDGTLGNNNTRTWMICGYGRTQTSNNGGNTYKGARLLNSSGGLIKQHPTGEQRNWVDGSAPVFEIIFINPWQVPANGIVRMQIETRNCTHLTIIPLNVELTA